MLSDPVSDMLTRIRNANQALHEKVSMPASKLKEEIARILAAEGYIDGYEVTYVYGGREYVTHMPYDPGDRIRVRVAVTPTLS